MSENSKLAKVKQSTPANTNNDSVNQSISRMYNSAANFLDNAAPDKIIDTYKYHLAVKDNANKNQSKLLNFKLIIALVSLILIALSLGVDVYLKLTNQIDDVYFSSIMVTAIIGFAADLRFVLKSFGTKIE